jgi:DDE family transposase
VFAAPAAGAVRSPRPTARCSGDLKRLVEPATMGDPMRPLTWVSKSREKLACELNASGHDVSPNTVGRLLVDALDYCRQVNRGWRMLGLLKGTALTFFFFPYAMRLKTCPAG